MQGCSGSRLRDYPEVVTVEEVVDETPTVRTLVFTDDVMASAEPGQFAMVWVPGAYELPMSVMVAGGGRRAAFTVRRQGPASSALYGVRPGGRLAVRGPYGNSFDLRRGRLLLVGGGTGLVPLMRLITRTAPADAVTVMMGARTADEVFFDGLAADLLAERCGGASGGRVWISTDDGTRGHRGRVTEAVEQVLGAPGGTRNFDAVYTCGPEPMMYKVVQLARGRGIFVQASLERMMKCGVGICGSCTAGSDIVCRDGTVFDGARLLHTGEFGLTYRDKAGIRVPG